MAEYNYERFDLYVENGEEEREFAAFPNMLHAGERAPPPMIPADEQERMRAEARSIIAISQGEIALGAVGQHFNRGVRPRRATGAGAATANIATGRRRGALD